MSKIKFILIFMLLAYPLVGAAQPDFLVKHKRSLDNYAEIQLVNQTAKALLCHVAIDGHKIRFTLQPRQPSKWYKATDTRFNFKNFSSWCDYLIFHPKYQK